MSVTLSLYNLLLVFLLSVTFLGIYAYYSVYQGEVSKRYHIFILRVFIILNRDTDGKLYFFTKDCQLKPKEG